MEEAAGRRAGPQTQNDSLSKHPPLGMLCVVCIQDQRLASEGRCFILGVCVFGLSVCGGANAQNSGMYTILPAVKRDLHLTYAGREHMSLNSL